MWIPHPVSDENQTIENVGIDDNYSSFGIYKEREFGNSILCAGWKNPGKERTLTYVFKVRRSEVVKRDFPNDERPMNRKEFARYLAATSFGPTTSYVSKR